MMMYITMNMLVRSEARFIMLSPRQILSRPNRAA